MTIISMMMARMVHRTQATLVVMVMMVLLPSLLLCKSTIIIAVIQRSIKKMVTKKVSR